MKFTTDKQTQDDLNLLGRYRPGSIYNLFNKVATAGGQRLLEELFTHPLSDPAMINRRSETFRYFQQSNLNFPLNAVQVTAMEQFLNETSGNTQLAVTVSLAFKKAKALLVKDETFALLDKGFRATIDVLHRCIDFLAPLGKNSHIVSQPELQRIAGILAEPRLSWLAEHREEQQLSLWKIARLVHLLQNTLRREMNELLDLLYQLDVNITVARIAREKGFTYANALPAEKNLLRVAGLRHPALAKGIGNYLSFGRDSNVLFLTGANMAGKSTLMKSFGIAVYLAHMGFPVAAEEMIFSVRDGLYSSINVPDNINLGYSHFYAEVLRVKQVALAVSQSRRLVVLFDELFKGTNVKDAYDATLAVTEAFAGYRNCCFIVSTHIIELGEALRRSCDNLQFSYLPTIMDGLTPRYTYTLQPGVTDDRQGMVIIQNEKILEILGASPE